MAVSIRCLKCGDKITSKHRHDFQTCRCGAISIDGGGDPYIRIIGDPENYEDVREED